MGYPQMEKRIIKARPEEAISFTDDTSPNLSRARQRPVSIHATVIKEKSLAWYYEFLRLVPRIAEELKSNHILQSYEGLSRDQKHRIWSTLKDVHIHIADALPVQAAFEQMSDKALGRRDSS